MRIYSDEAIRILAEAVKGIPRHGATISEQIGKTQGYVSNVINQRNYSDEVWQAVEKLIEKRKVEVKETEERVKKLCL